MSHEFPPKEFATNEVVDPDALNEVLQEAASKLAGRINEHDVASSIKTTIGAAPEAYYDGHHIMRQVAPGWEITPGFYGNINGFGPDAVADIEDSTGWQQIIDRAGTQALSVNITAGEGDILVPIALMQHVAWSGTSTAVAASIDVPLKLQYALRVDGAVLNHTITGAAIYPDPPAQPWYRATPSNSAGNSFDYRHIQYVQNTIGISPAVHPTRLFHSIPVAAGAHVVEVTAHRLPMSDYKIDTAGTGTTVQVFNRRLFVLRIKGMSPHSGEAPNVNIEAFDDGDTLTAIDLAANTMNVLRDNVNALANANIARGAFRNEHLPSLIYGPKAQPITPASPTAAITGVYPGFGVNSAAWSVVADGATNLRITGPTAGEWDLVANPGTFVVLANVQVAYVKWLAASTSNEAIGILALRMTNAAGTVTLLGECEVYVNGHNFTNNTGAAADSANIEDDIPLMWVVDSATLSTANKHIANVEVVGCTWDGAGGGAGVEMKTQRGCIFGFVLKEVTL